MSAAKKPRVRDPFGAASHRFEAGLPAQSTTPKDPPAEPATDPLQLSALLAELQATAEQLGAQLGDLGRAGRDAAAARGDQLPILRRVLELAPPELRARLTSAATMGLSATRDLADWLLAQMAPHTPPPEPEELIITPLDESPGSDA